MLPQTKGAKFLYDSFLKDFLKKNESKIDAALDDAKRTARSVGSEVVGMSAEVAAAGAKAVSDMQAAKNGTDKKDE